MVICKLGYKYALVAALMLAFSCNESKKPSPFIERGQMAAILTDMHLAEGITSAKRWPADSIAAAMRQYHELIYTKHKVNKEDFWNNYNYYVMHTEQLDSVMGDVMKNLNKMQTEK